MINDDVDVENGQRIQQPNFEQKQFSEIEMCENSFNDNRQTE